MHLDDPQLAVLFALQRENGNQEMSASHLFSLLPKILRERWTERYLRDVVLREMIRENLVTVRQIAPSKLHYELTGRGLSQLRALKYP